MSVGSDLLRADDVQQDERYAEDIRVKLFGIPCFLLSGGSYRIASACCFAIQGFSGSFYRTLSYEVSFSHASA